MADAELSEKLAQRLKAAEKDEDDGENDRIARKSPSAENDGSSNCQISNELKNKFDRRTAIIEGQHVEPPTNRFKNVYTEFTEFSRKAIKQYEQMFKKFDENKDGFICLEELKRTFEKLNSPQTHLSLKQMLKEVDEDGDNKINFYEFLLMFRKFNAGELSADNCASIFIKCMEIDVHEAGVKGAQQFFEAKAEQLARSSTFEAEIREEQELKRRELEEKKARHLEFVEKKKNFA